MRLQKLARVENEARVSAETRVPSAVDTLFMV